MNNMVVLLMLLYKKAGKNGTKFHPHDDILIKDDSLFRFPCFFFNL